ncbi:fatty acid desaturase [Nocardia sp. BMG51109]|uniref:fatty acid desaturase n=1 Tax=Nocardia sp. BMG51109 TaxID=1056816 RepID=UPI001E2B80FD|nr:fatty acid desaturase [Nocardia sp. BMG51109]
MRRALGPELTQRLDDLCARSRSEGPMDVVRDYAVVAATAALGTAVGHPAASLACASYIGVRQRHLSNLTHECIHTKLTRSRRANLLLGHVLTITLGEPFTPYKRSHRLHHAKLGSPDDPMLQSYLSRNAHHPRPSKAAFAFHVLARNAVSTLPASAMVKLAGKSPDESWGAALARWSLWSAATASAAATGRLGAFALYWAIPLIVVRPAVTWLTDLGNHAGLIENDDPFRQTRGWTSHWLTRHLLGGHNDDMYHPVHHLLPNVGWRQLPEAERLLRREYAGWAEVAWCSGFFVRRRSTPDIPSVLDDIVTRLQPINNGRNSY